MNETSTFEGEDIKHEHEQLPYTLPYDGTKGPGLHNLLEAGRGSSALTATINSTAFGYSSSSSAQTRSADATTNSNSVELRSFSQSHLADDEKSAIRSFGLSIPAQTRSVDDYADDERTER